MNGLHTPLSPQPNFPSLSTTWNRISIWLNREYPELGDTLNYGILPQDLAEIELQFGFPLPPAVRDSYLCVDGQEAESAAGCAEGLFFGLTFLPLEDVLEEWRFWREVDRDPTTGANPDLQEIMQSIPPDYIRKVYSNRGWIPLIADKAGNYLGIDLNPAEQGSAGQVIVFGRDFDTKVVLWNGDGPAGWARWLAAFADELESGESFEIGDNDHSEGSEDGIGYESYFHDGSGKGAGDAGGHSGAAGGLKLSGEYRGWNVLEAWGDRSLRKWHEAGLLPDYGVQAEEAATSHKASDSIGLGVVDLTQDSGAEVPIPVLAENEPIVPPPKPSSSHISRPSLANNVQTIPTISISKPPAPRPVDLPTENDIASPPESIHSVQDDDLEAGRSHTMREFNEDSALVSPKTKSPNTYAPLRRETSDAISPPPPSLERSALAQPTSTPLSPSSSSTPAVADLLGGSTSNAETALMQPSSPPLPTSTSGGDQSLANGISAPDSKIIDDLNEPSEDDSSSAGIRLVGGGGIVGIATEEITAEPEASVASVSETEPAKDSDPVSLSGTVTPEPETKAKHKKNKSSIVSLKKLALKSRKDSSASTKSVSSALAQ
ncbi:hypothetical protein EST38_g4857 [Candolleomyces aberdarensis]|uniref:Knr4/Smi1-like domain-containing protein n=1 Tax=Candolleomyces aberdarensis TaxID=2316362 RepID=A0A4Q2DM00_9AGAR|nr:hypothetical protein EST38_g4857 [Candolleomyces aberdarensis]